MVCYLEASDNEYHRGVYKDLSCSVIIISVPDFVPSPSFKLSLGF